MQRPTSSSESFKCKEGINTAVWIAPYNNVHIYALLGMEFHRVQESSEHENNHILNYVLMILVAIFSTQLSFPIL